MSGLVRGKALLVLVVGLAMIAWGCARPDWIQSTLVTVDVSGTWVGTFTRSGGTGDVTLTLQQKGATVTGSVKVVSGTSISGHHIEEEITGTVNGDVLRARSTSGFVQVELTVAGSEMAGPGSVQGPGFASTPGRFVLRQPDVVR